MVDDPDPENPNTTVIILMNAVGERALRVTLGLSIRAKRHLRKMKTNV
jgi:hypothetical protein